MEAREFKRFLKRAFRRCGLEVERYKAGTSSLATLCTLLKYNGVDLILDVGANVGQYAMDVRSAGYRGKIVSFEPLMDAHRKLVQKSRKDPLWEVAPRMAIGDQKGEAEINVSGNPASSSIKTMLEKHVESVPSSAIVGTETVNLNTLDNVAPPFMEGANAPFLKVDVQGYEAQVLAGAKNLISTLCGLQIELTLVPLYEGQTLYRDMIDAIEAAGFSLHGMVPGFTEPATGRLLQFDGIFFKGS